MVNDEEILEKAKLAEENDPLKQIERLEEKAKADELAWQKRENELLVKITKQAESEKTERRKAIKAEQAKKVAEWKYINQQEQQIDGVADLVNKETNDPQKRARQIFVERLKARREKSQKLAEERKENTFYI